tara:strand:+ start:14796 stop:15089 length:294 start_codon:yes stop_codon:yes gene_type:complete
MATTAIASQTAAANSGTISLAAGSSIQVYSNPALPVGEVVTLERTPDSGTTWLPVKDNEFRGVVLSGKVHDNTVTGPGDFRLRKSVTATATAVYYDS